MHIEIGISSEEKNFLMLPVMRLQSLKNQKRKRHTYFYCSWGESTFELFSEYVKENDENGTDDIFRTAKEI